MPHRASRILSHRSLLIALVLVITVGLGFLFLYGTRGGVGNPVAAECQASAALSERMAPLVKGEIAALQIAKVPKPLPDLSFTGPEGPMRLSDFRGRVVLLNLWATWCVPCREEMPALNRLHATLSGPNFTVIALNMDTRNTQGVPQWLKDNAIVALPLYTDAQGLTFQTLRKEGLVTGLPTTFILDTKGCTVASLAGPANWAGEEAFNVIRDLTR